MVGLVGLVVLVVFFDLTTPDTTPTLVEKKQNRTTNTGSVNRRINLRFHGFTASLSLMPIAHWSSFALFAMCNLLSQEAVVELTFYVVHTNANPRPQKRVYSKIVMY